MFLRCERFNVQAAAEMMVLHFEEKKSLSGDGAILAREVLQSDLGSNERIVLESGVMQIMNKRDAAGRMIFLVVTSKIIELMQANLTNFDGMYRVMWYFSMASAREEESQKKGYIWLIMNLCDFKTPMELYRRVGLLHSAIPHRLAAGHFCYDDQTLHPYVAGFHLFVGEEFKIRIRIHFGTRDEIDRALEAFGLPADAIPIYKNGTCNLAQHLEWLTTAQQQETPTKTTTLGDVSKNSDALPFRFDVLFGKSSMAKEHPGTLRALHLVQLHFSDYEKLGKCQKTAIAETIVSIIHESGGRFLKSNDKGCWMEVSDVEARRKVAHWFRQLRGKNYQSHQQESVERPSQGTPELANLINHLESIQSIEPGKQIFHPSSVLRKMDPR